LPRWLSPNDLWLDRAYRRLWLSALCSNLGEQVTMLAIPLAAALLLHATPTQMGWLGAMELLPFVLLSLPAGVWLDRVHKLRVYIGGELLAASALGSVPLVWALGGLSMPYLYGVMLVMGCVAAVAGSAAQIVLTQVVPRERLVEAHAKNGMASSSAEVAGPALAGVLIKLLGAPLALLADASLLLGSVLLLRGVRVPAPRAPVHDRAPFWRELVDGLRFVHQHALLPRLAWVVGLWQVVHHMAMVVQILFVTRELGLSEQQVGLSYTALGLGSVAASALGNRLSRRIGPGPCLVLGIALNGLGWLQLALVPRGAWGVASFVVMLAAFSAGAMLIFINFLALRQSVTPEPMLGRMTTTMRWLILLPAGPGALLGGYVGEHLGLRWALGLGGLGALLLAVVVLRMPSIRHLTRMPALAHELSAPPSPAAQ